MTTPSRATAVITVIVVAAVAILAAVFTTHRATSSDSSADGRGSASPLPVGTVQVSDGYQPTGIDGTELALLDVDAHDMRQLVHLLVADKVDAQLYTVTSIVVPATQEDRTRERLAFYGATVTTSRPVALPANISHDPTASPVSPLTPEPVDAGTGPVEPPTVTGNSKKPVTAPAIDPDSPWHVTNPDPRTLMYPVTRVTVPRALDTAVKDAGLLLPHPADYDTDTPTTSGLQTTSEPGVFILPQGAPHELIDRVMNATAGQATIDEVMWMSFMVMGTKDATGLPLTTGADTPLGPLLTYEGPALTKDAWYDYGRTVAGRLAPGTQPVATASALT